MSRQTPSGRKKNPYPGWNLYFEDEFKEESLIAERIKHTIEFLKCNPVIEYNQYVGNIDVNLLYNSKKFIEKWPDFQIELRDKPETTLSCLGLAAHQVKLEQDSEEEVKNVSIPFITLRIKNYHYKVPLNDIKITHYQKMVCIRGCVIRVNKPQQLITKIVLTCVKCKEQIEMPQKNGIYTVLKKQCLSCNGRKYEPDLASEHITSITFQSIRLQEHYNELNCDSQASVPRVMDVELTEDLVDTCMPGDDVSITGVIKMNGPDNGKVMKKNEHKAPLYLEANSVLNLESKTKNSGISSIKFELKDYKTIKEIHKNSDILSLLVHSLCPGIYGHEMIKLALLLSLFGGSSKHTNLRDNIHVLIVGDPGLGKSQLLQACAKVTSKGIYVSGNASTAAGLTATLTKDGCNDFALEPGALVLADRGTCCIDEFDKMPTQHQQSLLETMEQQSVSVAKSGIVWSLPARTSILAAANPKGGRYNKAETVSKNLNLSQPLLSRFDLVFLLLDKPDKDFDNFLSEHVMLLHNGPDLDVSTKNEYVENRIKSNTEQNVLKKRLMQASSRMKNIPPSALRKYISYARQYVKPTLSRECADILQQYYLNLRKKEGDIIGDVPVCLRQLEALIRLCEARAKVDLRLVTTEDDALEVIELFQNTIINLRENIPDISLISTSSKSKSSAKCFLNALEKKIKSSGKKIFSYEELKEIAAAGGNEGTDFEKIINQLNDQGILLKQSNDIYKLINF